MLFSADSQGSAAAPLTVWSENVSVVAGTKYIFKFDYVGSYFKDAYTVSTTARTALDVVINGQTIMTTQRISTGEVTVEYTPTTTGTIPLAIKTYAIGNGADGGLDNISFTVATPVSGNTMVAGSTAPGTSGDEANLVYTSGVINGQAGNDTITVASDLQAKLTAGGLIKGGAGVDTLKLATGTTLNLETLTGNQTVKTIQEVEVFELQGSSTLTLSANDVLSLGATNLAGYSFTTTVGSATTTSSTGKVQFVVNGTNTDTLVLDNLLTDGVTTNSTVGNTGLAGQWDYKGTVTIGSKVYNVYDDSNTAAQVLVDTNMNVPVGPSSTVPSVSFSSMTKDSGIGGTNADWLTSDVTAGRLVSGSISAALSANQTVKIYSNGVLIGDAVVNGTQWEITDIAAYSADWIYTAQVVDSSANTTGPFKACKVTTDFTEVAPVITAVTDTVSASIANAGTTTNALSSVSGTGNAGDTIYLYDNSNSNLVGTAIVSSDGTWSVSSLTGVFTGSNTFSAKQVDTQGNQSVLSNLWTVTSYGSNLLTNGDFSNGMTGYTSYSVINNAATSATNFYGGPNQVGTMPSSYLSPITNRATTPTNFSATSASGAMTITEYYDINNLGNPDSRFTGNFFGWNDQTLYGHTVFLSQQVSVVAGQTYSFSFDYASWQSADVRLYLGNTYINFAHDTAGYNELGRVKGTFTAATTGLIDMSFTSEDLVDFFLDNLTFTLNTSAGNSLVAGTTPPATPSNDTALSFTNGALTALAGDDVITATSTSLQSILAVGGIINGNAGVDRLKLAAGTTLNLETLTGNQTVKSIQEVEVFEMQGASTLTMSANDVLSLGATNLTGYNFSSTVGGTNGSTSSTGKVQFVVNGTFTDSLVLDNLLTDGVTSNGSQGNTGLSGQWVYMGTTTINGAVYNVYNDSNTAAQVLVDINVTSPSVVTLPSVQFSSMTKDTGLVSGNADWITADGSAGRLVSGSVSTALTAGQTVKVYSNGTLIGDAVVNGTQWEITDTRGYSADWTYTAQVAAGATTGPMKACQVTTDFTEAAPVITAVTDAAIASIANAGTSIHDISSVSGTGVAGDSIYLYDNVATNLVGTTTVSADGTWIVNSLDGIYTGSNTFTAKQIDALGNESVLSNLWAVIGLGTNQIVNGDFSTDSLTGFTIGSNTTWTAAPNFNGTTNNEGISANVPSTLETTTSNLSGTTTNANISWAKKYIGAPTAVSATYGNPDGAMVGNTLNANMAITTKSIFWQNSALSVEAGKTYVFKFDYATNFGTGGKMALDIDGVSCDVTTTNYESGRFTVTYTATTTKDITLALWGQNGAAGASCGDITVDNLSFATAPLVGGNVLVAGTYIPGSSSNDSSLTYSSGALSGLAGNDTMTAGSDLQAQLVAGGFINGGAGVDTLKLAASTDLNLLAVTGNQTVKSIQEVEVIEMQGNSSLIMSVNDALSLGGANATTMSAYSFASTTQTAYGSTAATGSTSSIGKVQFVVNGTSTDSFSLGNLNLDAVTTNGAQGNTGLAGQWDYKGTTSLTVGGVTTTYRVYDHSTTQAQLLVDTDVTSSLGENAVTITGVQASGTTSKVINETFDSLPYTNLALDSFTTNNGLTFNQDILLPSFTIGADGTGVNGVGRALIINNANLPGGANQWGVTTPLAVSSVTMNYWDMSAASAGLYVASGTRVAMSAAGTASAPWSVTGLSGVTASQFGIAGSPNDKYFIDNLQVRMNNVAETTDIASGGVTRFTTGVVSGSLATPLLAGQYLQVFSNGVSLGNATVSGISWTFADTIAASGESYTVKVMNANGTEVATSNSYAVNHVASSTPKLTISDDASSAVASGVSVNYTFQFDQAVTGFDATDINVTNGGVKGPLIQLDAKTWVMSINSPNSGAGDTTVSVADGSFTATTGGAAGVGNTDSQAFDDSMTQYIFDQFGNGSTTGNAATTINSGAADDYIITIGKTSDGVEVINTGAGDDTVEIQASNITKLALATGNASFDGGSGIDTLQVYGTGLTLDLSNVTTASHVKNFESVDITGVGNNILKIDLNAVLNMTNLADNPDTVGVNENQMMVINGNAGDSLQLVNGSLWSTVATGQTAVNLSAIYGSSYHFATGATYTEYTINSATLFVDELITKSNV